MRVRFAHKNPDRCDHYLRLFVADLESRSFDIPKLTYQTIENVIKRYSPVV